ncbi:MAG: hypothetical protein AAGI72_18460 [Pseudomonadota bacterium]
MIRDLLIGFVLILPIQAIAGPISLMGAFTIDDTSGAPEFAIGDTFEFAFTYDELITDSFGSNNTNRGQFVGAVTAISLTRTGGSGSWNPANGTFTLPTVINTLGNRARVRGTGAGFDTVDGLPFFSFDLNFDLLVTDTGNGQSLADQIGPMGLATVPISDISASFGNVFDPIANGFLTSFSVATVPLPATGPLFLLGLVSLRALRWRRRKKRS